MSRLVKVARGSEIADGAGKVVEADGRKLALFHSGGRYYAIDNACLHRGGPLGEGDIYGTTVVCPLHGWEYDFSTGCSIDDPAMRLACFKIVVEGDDILVEL